MSFDIFGMFDEDLQRPHQPRKVLPASSKSSNRVTKARQDQVQMQTQQLEQQSKHLQAQVQTLLSAPKPTEMVITVSPTQMPMQAEPETQTQQAPPVVKPKTLHWPLQPSQHREPRKAKKLSVPPPIHVPPSSFVACASAVPAHRRPMPSGGAGAMAPKKTRKKNKRTTTDKAKAKAKTPTQQPTLPSPTKQQKKKEKKKEEDKDNKKKTVTVPHPRANAMARLELGLIKVPAGQPLGFRPGGGGGGSGGGGGGGGGKKSEGGNDGRARGSIGLNLTTGATAKAGGGMQGMLYDTTTDADLVVDKVAQRDLQMATAMIDERNQRQRVEEELHRFGLDGQTSGGAGGGGPLFSPFPSPSPSPSPPAWLSPPVPTPSPSPTSSTKAAENHQPMVLDDITKLLGQMPMEQVVLTATTTTISLQTNALATTTCQQQQQQEHQKKPQTSTGVQRSTAVKKKWKQGLEHRDEKWMAQQKRHQQAGIVDNYALHYLQDQPWGTAEMQTAAMIMEATTPEEMPEATPTEPANCTADSLDWAKLLFAPSASEHQQLSEAGAAQILARVLGNGVL